ncbi:MAG: hypothetical protein IJX90_00110 [Blautia sp.]|nr:hypothetical protein [Blautia sp.]
MTGIGQAEHQPSACRREASKSRPAMEAFLDIWGVCIILYKEDKIAVIMSV